MDDDTILVLLYGAIGVAVFILVGYAAREWLTERHRKKSDRDAEHVEAVTFDTRRGEWVKNDDE